MTPAELEALRKARDVAAEEADSAQCAVTGMARAISRDWRNGVAPGRFALDLLAELVDDHREAQKAAVATAEAVVAAYDAQCGRVQP